MSDTESTAPPERQLLIGLGLTGGLSFLCSLTLSWGIFTAWMIVVNLVMIGSLVYDWQRTRRGKKRKLSPWYYGVMAVVGAAPTLHAQRTLTGSGSPSTGGVTGYLFHVLTVFHSVLLALALLFVLAPPLVRGLIDLILRMFGGTSS